MALSLLKVRQSVASNLAHKKKVVIRNNDLYKFVTIWLFGPYTYEIDLWIIQKIWQPNLELMIHLENFRSVKAYLLWHFTKIKQNWDTSPIRAYDTVLIQQWFLCPIYGHYVFVFMGLFICPFFRCFVRSFVSPASG